MCIAIVCQPGCDVKNVEINLINLKLQYGPLSILCDTKCDISTINQCYLLICYNKKVTKNIEFSFEN